MRPVVPILLAVGCAPAREPAPADLDGLLHWTYRYFEDDAALAEGSVGLADWLDTTGRTEVSTDGFLVDPLRHPDVVGLVRPDRPLADAVGIGVGWISPYPILDHADLVVLPDQTYLDPPAYERNDREILDGDAVAFVAGEGTLRTDNVVEKGKVGVIIPYELRKDYTWVSLDDGGLLLASRSWEEESGCNDGGSNCLWQTYSVDVWYAPDPDAPETLRVMVTWNELTTSADAFLSEDQKVAVAVNAMVDMFEGTDAALAER